MLSFIFCFFSGVGYLTRYLVAFSLLLFIFYTADWALNSSRLLVYKNKNYFLSNRQNHACSWHSH